MRHRRHQISTASGTSPTSYRASPIRPSLPTVFRRCPTASRARAARTGGCRSRLLADRSDARIGHAVFGHGCSRHCARASEPALAVAFRASSCSPPASIPPWRSCAWSRGCPEIRRDFNPHGRPGAPGPDRCRATLVVEGKPAAKCTGLLSFVCVEDVDVALRRVEQHGRSVVRAARPDGSLRVATLRDP